MTQTERIEQYKQLAGQYRLALTMMTLGRVTWLGDRRTVPTVGGMPPSSIRVGVAEGGVGLEALAVIHRVDDEVVTVQTAYEVAQWPTPTVLAYPGLQTWLLRNLVITSHVNVHVPGCSWLRTAAAKEMK